MKITVNILLTLFAINLMSCGTSPVINESKSETNTIEMAKYSRSEIENIISKCTSLLRKAIETHFIGASDLGDCNTPLTQIISYVTKNSYRNTQLINDAKRYQNIFSEIYRNRKLFSESNKYVQNIKKTNNKIKLHIDILSKIFLNSSGNTAKDFAYVIGGNEVLLDRMNLNAEFAINRGANIDERVKKLDRLAKDAAIFGKILYGMLRGDKKLRIKKLSIDKLVINLK